MTRVISVVIPVLNSARDLQPLLAALVPAAVDGLVREVVIADGGSTDGTAALCEDAGAVLVKGGLAEAAAVAKSDRVLILPVEMRLPHDWARRLAEHLEAGGGAAVINSRRRRKGLFGVENLPSGMLLTRAQVQDHGRAGLKALRTRLRKPARIS